MQKTIANKLAKDPDSISSKELYKWLISIDDDERFDFLTTIDDIGQKSSPSLIEKMQAVLNGEVLINKTSYSIDIRIPETFPTDKVMYFLKKYNFGKFSFSSLKYFDKPLVRNEFCNILLSECNKKNSVMFGINRFWLSLKIEQEVDELSIAFLMALHNLLSRLYQIESLSTLKQCQQLIYSKIKDRQIEEKSSPASLDTTSNFHDITYSEKEPTIEYSRKEQSVVYSKEIEFPEENNLNKSRVETKKRSILDFFKSLFK
jgi:hypothetical protein